MRIGIIEDDTLLRKALDTSLKNQGYTTILAGSRKEAIKNIDSSVDLLIVDIGLPDGDGINLYQELQKNGRIPAIFLTAKDDEKDMLKVGYGAMVLESLLAVLALCVAGAAAAADGTPAAGTPFQVFSSGVAGFFEMFGIPVYIAQCFMTMCVSALALTSLDAVSRIGRMSFQELFSVDDMEHAEGWRKLLCNTYFSTIVTLLCAYVLTRIGYANIWPLFGSANQLLSALVLVTLCVFMKVTGRSNKMLFAPLIIMLCVTGTALVERTIGLVKAYAAGYATFLVEGLQLIIAVLLMALGLVIVINSLKAYFGAKKESEA